MTNKELAKIIGVSEATVSLVINGKNGISEKTRKKVLARIKECGYEDMIKNVPERSINIHTDQIGKNIGFVLYKDGGQLLGLNSFFPLIFNGIESTARKHNYNLLVINIDRQEIETQIRYIEESNCRGFVIFATEMQEPEISKFEDMGIPFVIFDNYFINSNINAVKVNNEQGTYLAVKYLYQMGHRRVGYLSSGLNINSFHEREKCAKENMRNMGMENPERYSYTLGYPVDNAEARMTELLNDHVELPTAFITDNDLVAIGAVQALKKAGISVPDEISVIGYDDRPICEMVEPTLSTIRLPREYFGAEAVEKLVSLIKGNVKGVSKTEINGQLIVRESVKNINL